MNHEKQKKILSFWFGEDALRPLANMKMWFAKNPAVDEQIREKFGDMLIEAGTGAYDDWAKTSDGALALVLLLDQFPRQNYRDDEKAFSFDERALHASQIAIAHGFDRKLTVVERCFLYLPFEHSESPLMQTRAVELFGSLLSEAHGEERGFIAQAMEYALSHQRIIEKFGRFPHRNAILGRDSTAQEREFLKRPGSSF